METFEFVVTSIARVALKEHVKIQAEGVEDAITRIEDNDYYEEDGEILSREYELIDYESTEDIMDWENTAEYKLNSKRIFMDKRVLIICRGIQGSGKSTWAKQWCHEDPEHRVRFNNDDIRNMLGDYWVPNREKLVTEAKANMITFALIKGYDVVVDNMNLNPKEDEWIRTLCANIEKDKGIHVDIEYKDFWTPVEECIRRDAMRPNPIGEKVIRQTWRRYKDFIIHEEIMAAKAKSLVQDTNLPAAIIVDMDATVCLNTSGRPFYGEGAAEGMLTDEPITPVIELIRNFCDNYPAKLIILTGREDTPEVRKATEQWLENNWLHPDILLMRPVKSFTAGPICKKKLYEDNIKGKFYIPFVLEDNCKCVEMWRNEGLICLQPNEGKF